MTVSEQQLKDNLMRGINQLILDSERKRRTKWLVRIGWFEIICGFLLIGLTVTLLLVDAGVIPNVNPFL
jgi:hypothetical protein|tara:strand:- start:885 stop:1091 length:207 start_codon:yes stop_codon:yes gene_type:complete